CRIRPSAGSCGTTAPGSTGSRERALIDPRSLHSFLVGCALTTICVLWSGQAPALDRVRAETRTDDAVAQHGVTGRGVTVAILDRGIDWRNPDLRNPDGTTRIKWLLDMSKQTTGVCPGSPVATEYSEAQINAALAGGPAIGGDDFVGHGTMTAGSS